MHVVVHGGAGSDPREPEPRQETLDEAAATGKSATTPTDAVVEATRVLESGPRFNAGVGGAVQSDGQIRTDAGLMTGDGTTGGACSMPGVEHAVEVARVVAEETPHIMISGEHALSVAEAFDVATDRDLWTERSQTRWDELDPVESDDPRDHLSWLEEKFGGSDTVGAVASDGERVAAATSTGGRWCAMAGRVGDVPQVGSGFYATENAAVSTTGAGEEIAKFGLARRVADAIEGGETPAGATDRLIQEFDETTDASAGIIAVDTEGQTGEAFNSSAMQTATDHT
ncbi:isoaspartyl peptidase/L-asparaginase [Halovenus salina]|uniref:Plant-type L-asparaginase n=1 Tax=Halovenus salina TaxID=1510225 RepID=A0ABD5VZU1_9EURY|nr:isoaspartyl peptidase/L-asparaginase [Halovenus salina]